MMKTADLYIRVSTDEQADRGYSQRSQEEHLIKYCETNGIRIGEIIREDHSAKTFLRPAWQRYLREIRRKQSDLLLFLKWDRFSRNAGDAYEMIKILRMHGIEPQAIEQPLDLSIPENKMMLAFYLAAPEVENDRRALNVIHGMRRAMKEGRCMCTAPFGYLNKAKEDGRKYIAIHEPDAAIVRWMYGKIAEGIYNTEQIYKLAKQKGFSMTRSAFWDILRNPTYHGKIVVRKYKNEEKHSVKGLHEPIISEVLFYRVQQVLNGRKRDTFAPKIFTDNRFPLRGFLICPNCKRPLTASESKGRGKYYAYYHCTVACRTRFKKSLVEEHFNHQLRQFVINPELQDVCESMLKQSWNNQTKRLKENKQQLVAQIKEMQKRLSYIRELLASGQIDASDFKEMKIECNDQLEELEARLADSGDTGTSINSLMKKGLQSLFDLDAIYHNSSIERKRDLIGSLFPDKMIFDGTNLHVGRVNEVAKFVYLINGKSFVKGAISNTSPYSSVNESLSIHFIDDLQKLAALSDSK